ncbi:MAG: hypothetical protein E4G93_06300 [Dehalococcoidia bacterium]|nr:MAG: hypothetical protein E4G93_06300 [Dehalococcoidia bacterium]
MDKGKSGGTGLETHVASTLAYVGGWVSGLIFLLIEKENRVVRFHAMQSIIVFGVAHILIVILSSFGSFFTLGAWGGALMPVSIVFTVLWSLLLAFSIVLWILLMVRTYHKQQVLVPLAGDLAFWMLDKFGMQAPERDAMAFQGLGESLPRRDERPRHARFEDSAAGRAVGSVAVIVWSIVLFVVFNFFADYIAFYYNSTEGGISQLLRYPILTAELSRVLPIFNAALGVSVLGHLIVLAWNRFVVHEAVQVVIHAMGLVVALVFLKVFPFDYSELPIAALVTTLPTVTLIIIVLTAVGNLVETIVHLVRFVTGFSVR